MSYVENLTRNGGTYVEVAGVHFTNCHISAMIFSLVFPKDHVG
jgi:hypothetical protein